VTFLYGKSLDETLNLIRGESPRNGRRQFLEPVNVSRWLKSNQTYLGNNVRKQNEERKIAMRRFSNLGLGTLFAVGLFMTASPAFAQNDIRHDRHDIRHDRRDLHSDRQNIHNQRVDLHNDYQTLRQNRTTLRNDVKNGASTDHITADRQAVHNEVKDIRGDQRGLFNDRRDVVRDSRDLRGDRRDLRQDLHD